MHWALNLGNVWFFFKASAILQDDSGVCGFQQFVWAEYSISLSNILSTEVRKWCENSSRPILTNAQGGNRGRLSFKWFRHSFSMHFSTACALVVTAVYGVSPTTVCHPTFCLGVHQTIPYKIHRHTCYCLRSVKQFAIPHICHRHHRHVCVKKNCPV